MSGTGLIILSILTVVLNMGCATPPLQGTTTDPDTSTPRQGPTAGNLPDWVYITTPTPLAASMVESVIELVKPTSLEERAENCDGVEACENVMLEILEEQREMFKQRYAIEEQADHNSARFLFGEITYTHALGKEESLIAEAENLGHRYDQLTLAHKVAQQRAIVAHKEATTIGWPDGEKRGGALAADTFEMAEQAQERVDERLANGEVSYDFWKEYRTYQYETTNSRLEQFK